MIVGRVEFGRFGDGVRAFFLDHPFHQLSPTTDLRRDEPVAQRGDFIAVSQIFAQRVAGGVGTVH